MAIKEMHLRHERRGSWDTGALLKMLAQIIGEDRVTTNRADLACYAFSGTGLPQDGKPDVGVMPDIVVQPMNAKDVLEVVRIANRFIVPVYPVTTGFQSSYPHYGGIVMDLYRMDKILEVNTDDGYAVVEPGVSFARLANTIRPLGYRFPFGSFPETTSVVGALMERRAPWSTWLQTSGRELSNLELVLGNGKLLRTGAGAYPQGGDWSIFSSHAIMPDYTRLFTSIQGGLGIAVKATVRIWAHNETRKVVLTGFDDVSDALRCVRELSRAYIIEGSGIYQWGATTFFGSCFGDKEGELERFELVSKLHSPEAMANAYPIYEKHPDHPYVYCYLIFSGFVGEVEHRVAFAGEHVRRCGGVVYDEDEAPGQLGQFGADMYSRWLKRGFEEHYHPNDLMRLKYGGYEVGGRGGLMFVGRPSAVPAMQDELMRHMWSAGCRWGFFGFKLEDQARNCYFRFSIYLPGEQPLSKLAELKDDLTAIAKNHGMHSFDSWISGDSDMALPATNELACTIKEYCDPNGILNPWHSYAGR